MADKNKYGEGWQDLPESKYPRSYTPKYKEQLKSTYFNNDVQGGESFRQMNSDIDRELRKSEAKNKNGSRRRTKRAIRKY